MFWRRDETTIEDDPEAAVGQRILAYTFGAGLGRAIEQRSGVDRRQLADRRLASPWADLGALRQRSRVDRRSGIERRRYGQPDG